MREGLIRQGWLLLVLACFCVPLFVGLGATDLDNDEAIYSYAVESILTIGNWLSPASSPNHDIVFLEKPPLKFWIVAAPIAAGILPYNEFGLRFWDALFGSLAFVYVFLIARRLAGAVCGFAAVLLLFAHGPLLFDHGLRSNNMDAALVLAYCGGVFHYQRWAASGAAGARFRHAAAIAGWFYLGFMTKFVAALFLPLVLGACALAVADHRRHLRADRWRWLLLSSGVVLAAAPWFVYQYLATGGELWDVIFGQHVYQRFTSFADPGHVQPWHFYLSQGYTELLNSQSAIWVGFGLGALLWQAIKGRDPNALLMLLWLAVPVALISLGSSKLYHYLYPFLPPAMIAGGFGIERLLRLIVRAPAHAPAWSAFSWTPPPWIRAAGAALTLATLALAFWTAIDGPVQIHAGGVRIFRNTSLVRPIAVAACGLLIAGGLKAGAGVAILLLVTQLLPTPVSTYVEHLERLDGERHPLRSVAACIDGVREERRADGQPSAGLYAPVAQDAFLHPYFYYFRGDGWQAADVDFAALDAALFLEGHERPVVIDKRRWAAYLAGRSASGRRIISIDLDRAILLLPGMYGVCGGR